MSEEMKKLFYELKQYLVPHSPNWNILCETEQYILNLEQENKELKALEESEIRPIEKCCKYMKVLKLKKKIEEELECTLVKGLLDLS